MKRVDRASHELIQKTISDWLGGHGGPLEASPLLPLAEARDLHWLVLRLRVVWRDVALSREAFFQRARSTGVIHKLDLLALDRVLVWLLAHPEWHRGIVPISQYALLVPGCVGQVLRRVQQSGLEANRIAIHLATHADLDFPEHMASVAKRFREHGITVTSNRFAPKPELDADLGLAAVFLEKRLTHQLGHTESSRAAVTAIIERAGKAGIGVIAPPLHSAKNRQQARALGVGYECARAQDPDHMKGSGQDHVDENGTQS